MKRFRAHILVACVVAIALLTGVHKALQSALVDIRFSALPRAATGNIVLVAIDSPSIERMGAWPWPRQRYAELIDRLVAAGANEIVFDVDFSSPSNPVSDLALADALDRAGGSAVLPAFRQWAGDRDSGRKIYVNRPLPLLEQRAWTAIVNVGVERDGLVRRYSFGDVLDDGFLPSVGAILAGRHETQQRPFWIDYSISAASVPTVSFYDVLRGDASVLGRLKDKKIIVGATAIELGDRFSVPNGEVLPGALVQTLAAESIVQGRVLRRASDAVNFGALGLLLLLMAAMWRRRANGWSMAVIVAAAAGMELNAIFVQQTFAVIVDTSLWHLASAAYLAALALEEIDFRGLLTGIAENRFKRVALALGDGLVCADQNGRITFWNPGAAAIFGYAADEVAGHRFERLLARDEGGADFSLPDLSPEALALPGGKVLEVEGRRKSGENFPLELSVSAWQGVDGRQYGLVMRDISERKRETEKIRYLAEHDTLTDLANRNRLYAHLTAAFAEAGADAGQVALMMLDLDKFKQVNDALGHVWGDRLLCGVARRLAGLADAGCLVARLGGDEFAVVVSGKDAVVRARDLAARAAAAFRNAPFDICERKLCVNISIGVAVYPDFAKTVNELFDNADLALYRAKSAGRGRCVVFERTMREELDAQIAIEVQLEHAIERGELELYYQPQVRLRDGKLQGAEALIRWRHPNRGLILPSDFMPIVNASPIANRIALWVMETACVQGRAWEQKGKGVRIGVNLSPSQLQSGDLPKAVAAVLERTRFSPRLLELEVTENILLDDDELALETFRRIQSMGVNIAFDDFGTGFASMTYLKKYPLDTLKIDKSFVAGLRTDSDNAAIVNCTIDLGSLLGLSVIAEGVEDAMTVKLLSSMGCEEGQGYFFGPPMPAAEFEERFLLEGGAAPANSARRASAA